MGFYFHYKHDIDLDEGLHILTTKIPLSEIDEIT